MLRVNERNSSQHFWPNNVGSSNVRLHVPLQHAAERDWHGLFQNISVHNNNNNNFIDFIFDMKISVPKQWQMKQSKKKI